MDGVEEGGDWGEEAAGEDVAVDEGWDGGSCVVELYLLVFFEFDIRARARARTRQDSLHSSS